MKRTFEVKQKTFFVASQVLFFGLTKLTSKKVVHTTFKAASLSCYIIAIIKILELLNKQPPYSIKIFLKSHNHLNKLLHRIERTKMTYSLTYSKCAT